MQPLDQLLPLLSTCYEAPSNPALWHTLAEQLQHSFAADRIYLNAIAHKPHDGIFAITNCDLEALGKYADYWQGHDIVLRTVTEQLQQQGFWTGELESILPFRDLESSHLYNDSPDFRGLRYMLGTSSAHVPSFGMVGLGIWRRDAQGAFAAEHHELLRLLQPHLLQSLRLHAQLVSLRAEADLLRSAVETTGSAFLALGLDGRILLASPAAASFLRDLRHGLRDRAGRLQATDPATDRKLQHLLQLAVGTANLSRSAVDRPAGSPLSSMHIPRSAGLRPLILQATAYRGALQAVCPAALVFLTDPDSTPPSREQLLRDLFHLSPVEARLTDLLAQGLELRDAGDRLRLSYDSARFHLKQVFSKSGTRRQAELLRLIATLPALQV